MNVNLFRVPNNKQLGDRLVQDVQQRASTRRSRTGESYHQAYLPDLSQTGEIPAPFDGNKMSPTKPTSKTNQLSSLATPTDEMMRLLEMSTDGSNGTDLLKYTEAIEAIIRQQRRLQQRKYRKQQHEYTENLEKDVRKIQEEIRRLEQQLQYASIGISHSQTLWGAATDYFRLFKHGFRLPSDALYTCALNVLELSMSPNVTDGLVCGPKAILMRWTMFSLCFDDIFVDLQRLEKGPVENSVVATITTSITISTDSLRLVFPHLIEGKETDKITSSPATSLAAKLLGQRLVMRGSVIFEWDETIGRVGKMQSQSDMLTPLLEVLGNLEDVSHVLNGLLVTPECSWSQISV